MKHYLKALKQKNSLLFSVGIVMLLVLTFYLSGCSGKNEVQDQTNGADTIPNQSASAEEPSSILYVNHQLGFSMEMPLNWMGQVEVEEEYGLHHQNGGNCITFYHKPTHDNGEGGILFFIDCYPGEWSEDNPPVIAGHSVVVAQTEKDTYLLRTPSDVEYSESDPMLAEAYQSLIAQQDLIISHMKMIVRRTVLAVCTLVLALILPTAASAACTGFDDVPESADCYKSEIYILRSMRLRKARGTDASPRMRRLRPVNGLSCSAAPTTSM